MTRDWVKLGPLERAGGTDPFESPGGIGMPMAGERSGKDFWAKFEEQAGKIGWNLVREEKPEGLEMVGWLQDGFGNEIHVVKRIDVQDLRLVVYLFFPSEACTREALVRVADLCWMDGLTWRLEKDPQRPESTLLIGLLLPPARISQDHLWYVFNVMIFCEFGIRKLMPQRSDRELMAMLHRFTRNWARLSGTPEAANPVPAAHPVPEGGVPELAGTLEIQEQSPRLVLYSLTDPKGDHCVALCSRLPEHREFCWLIPDETDVWNDFVRLGAHLSGRKSAKTQYVPVDGGPIENQVVRILGDWSRDWSFSEQIFEDSIFMGVEQRKPTFHIYRMQRPTSSSWVLHNASLCHSLWVMDESLYQEFTELMTRWIKRIEVV